MGVVIVDGIEVPLAEGERLNGIQAARRAGIEIPHYCWHAGLSVVASCRMCLVEQGTRNPQTGAISMVPKLVPACQTPATDNTVFVTDSDKVRHSRAFVEECLLIDHPVDCPICDKAGECHLQDYHFEHGQEERRADIRPFTSRRREVGPTVSLFVDRCVMCTRCVRFTREISGTSELMVIDRGSHDEIDVVPGFPLQNKLAGNVVDLCPVGALGDKDFLYSQRVWFMKRHPGVCTGCATGCAIFVEENQDRVYRIKPRENPHVNHWWICDEGRYGYHTVHSPERVTELQVRGPEGYAPADWSRVLAELPAQLAAAGRLGAALSPHLTVEEAYLLATWIKQLDPQALLVLGPVPTAGTDEHYPAGFTIRAEKCPNRRGLESVLQHFAGEVVPFERLLAAAESGEVRAAWLSGGYVAPWIDPAQAARLESLSLLVVQDLFASPAWELASHRLPGGAFAEREGSYVNHSGRLQTASWAVRPPQGARVEASVYWQLAGRPGLFPARRVLAEVAATIPAFAAAVPPIAETGVDLTQPAEPDVESDPAGTAPAGAAS